MRIELPPLPYDRDELEPFVSSDTLELHHDKHHRAYVDKTNELVGDTDLAGADLARIIHAAKAAGDVKLLNQAGQAWNHNAFWPSMRRGGGGRPEGALGRMIDKDFGGFDNFRTQFKEEGEGHFASGWVWLGVRGGRLEVTSLHDGDTPLTEGDFQPLVTCDVWEHAYYLDYQNKRAAFLEAFIDNLLNWDFATANLERDLRTAS